MPNLLNECTYTDSVYLVHISLLYNIAIMQYGNAYFSTSYMVTSLALGVILRHYSDVIMGAIASEITSLTIVHSTVYSDADQRKNQSFASLACVRGIRRGSGKSPHKWPVTRKMFPFDDVIMDYKSHQGLDTSQYIKLSLHATWRP